MEWCVVSRCREVAVGEWWWHHVCSFLALVVRGGVYDISDISEVHERVIGSCWLGGVEPSPTYVRDLKWRQGRQETK